MSTPAGLADFDSGTPAIPLDQQLLLETAVPVFLGVPVMFPGIQFARSSYIITIDALAPAPVTIPFITGDMYWVDPSSGATIAHEQWHIPATVTSPPQTNALVCGRGPTKSAVLNLNIQSYDPLQTITCDLALYQSTRVVTRDDWRSIGLGAMGADFTNSGNDPPALLFGNKGSAELNAGTSVARMCALYSGAAQFCLLQDNAQQLAWKVQAAQPATASALWPAIAGATQSSDQFNYSISLPRAPVLVTVTNNGGSATNVQWCLTGQEFAS